ncbi:MAG: ABC transporter permease [Dethiobacter sp.]|jgi:ABC-2 type transport system permease protein|nr:ABC transporter permease [Dethiobacter sp.]
MKNSLTVAVWEIKQLINKSYLFSLLLTPALILIFSVGPGLLGHLAAEQATRLLYVVDELGVFQDLSRELHGSNINLQLYAGELDSLEIKVRGKREVAYVVLSPQTLTTRQVAINTGAEGTPDLSILKAALQRVLQRHELREYNLKPETLIGLEKGYNIQTFSLSAAADESPLRRTVQGIFAAIMYFVVTTTGMLIMQSAITEKRDRMAEVLLSSVSAGTLMRGKMLGCFVPGVLQGIVWAGSAALFAYFYYDLSIWQYLLEPRVALLLFFLLAGYLLFAAVFISLGATMDDPMQASNLQGLVILIPYLPFLFIGPVIADPNGLLARVGSYFPFTTSGVMLARLVFADQVIFLDIILSAVLLLATSALTIWLAGKIFQTGFLLYGKVATPREIIRWLRSS